MRCNVCECIFAPIILMHFFNQNSRGAKWLVLIFLMTSAGQVDHQKGKCIIIYNLHKLSAEMMVTSLSKVLSIGAFQ